jgi:hypothetical protein
VVRALLKLLFYFIPMLFVRLVIPSLAMIGVWNLLSSGIVRISFPPTAGEVFVLIILLAVAIFWLPLAAFAMDLATPKAVLDRYFAPPHFSEAEVSVFPFIYPWVPIEMIVFMAACTLPRHRMKGRQLTEFRDHVPHWYVRCSRVLFGGFLAHLALLIGLCLWLALLAFSEFRGPIDWHWYITAALLAVLVCLPLAVWLKRRRVRRRTSVRAGKRSTRRTATKRARI